MHVSGLDGTKSAPIGPYKTSSGFTIVELIIAIIVIGILASLVLIGYVNVADRARDVKIAVDTKRIKDAISVAQIRRPDTPLSEITGNTYTSGFCAVGTAANTDLAKLPKSNICWTDYYKTMDNLTVESGVPGLHDLVDPWGRPYYIDENELERPADPCIPDYISVFKQPFVPGPNSFVKYDITANFNTRTCL